MEHIQHFGKSEMWITDLYAMFTATVGSRRKNNRNRLGCGKLAGILRVCQEGYIVNPRLVNCSDHRNLSVFIADHPSAKVFGQILQAFFQKIIPSITSKSRIWLVRESFELFLS